MTPAPSHAQPAAPSVPLSAKIAVRLYQDLRLSVLLLILVFGAGCIALLQMPRLEDPPLSKRGGTITTLLPGADASQVEATVTEKLEEELLELPELKKLSSQSRQGVSVLSFEFKEAIHDTEMALSRLRSRVQAAIAKLPPGASEPIVAEIESAAYSWIGALVCQPSTDLSPGQLSRLAQHLSDRLRELPGTKLTDLWGLQEEEVLVDIDASRAAQLGLSNAEIASCLNHTDAKQSAGTLIGSRQELSFRIANQFDSLQKIANTQLRDSGNGNVLLLKDVASIQRGIRTPASSLAIVDGLPAVIVAARTDLAYSLSRWTHAVEGNLAEYRSELPHGVHLEILLVQNDYVAQRMFSLLTNLLVGLLAVALTTVVFLGWRPAMLVTATLPLGAFMVLAGLNWMSIPLHQMSVTGLILSLGLMIDNAIIVIDELCQAIRRPLRPLAAMTYTCRRLAIPLLGSTATTVLAFVPLALMAGPTGEFVGSIGIAVMLSVISSLIIALTLLPAVAVHVLQRSPLSLMSQGLRLPTVERLYTNLLRRILKRPAEGLVLGALLPILGFTVAARLPEQFFPAAERNQFMIDLELDASATILDTLACTQSVDSILKTTPNFEQVSWFIAGTGPAFYYNHIPLKSNIPSFAQAVVRTTTPVASAKVLNELQTKLNQQVPGASLTVRQFEQGPPSSAPIELRILGDDPNRLQQLGDSVRKTLLASPGVTHVRSEMSEMRPVADVQLDPLRLRATGLDERSVGAQLASQLDGLIAGSLIEQTEELKVRVRSVDSHSLASSPLEIFSTASIGQALHVNPSSLPGKTRSFPLAAIGKIALLPERAVITHHNGQRVNELQAFMRIGQPSAPVIKEFAKLLNSDDFETPFGYRIEIAGEAAERASAVSSLSARVPAVVIAGLAVLVLTLQSFRLALVIAAVGLMSVGMGTGSLWLIGYPIGFTAIIGFLALVGVAINDSIVVLTALREDALARQGNIDAMVRTILDCTRHVLCTTFTTLLGFLPLMLGGGSFWPPMAVVIGCGIAGASLTALTFLPCLYRLLATRRGASPFDSVVVDKDGKEIEQQLYEQLRELTNDVPHISPHSPASSPGR